jgi:hypothetical protein
LDAIKLVETWKTSDGVRFCIHIRLIS